MSQLKLTRFAIWDMFFDILIFNITTDDNFSHEVSITRRSSAYPDSGTRRFSVAPKFLDPHISALNPIIIILPYYHKYKFARHRLLVKTDEKHKPSKKELKYLKIPTVTCSKSCPSSCDPATTSRSAIHCSISSMSRLSRYSFRTSSSLFRRSPVKSLRMTYSLSTCACFVAIASLCSQTITYSRIILPQNIHNWDSEAN